MSEKIKVCASEDLKTGAPLRVEIENKKIALVRAEDNNIYAINDICSHGEISLSEGFVEGCSLECWAHGAKFDLKTGWPVTLPAYEPVEIYETDIIDGFIYINPKGKIMPGKPPGE